MEAIDYASVLPLFVTRCGMRTKWQFHSDAKIENQNPVAGMPQPGTELLSV